MRESVKKPTQRTREYAEIIRRVARGDELEFSGEVLNLSGFTLYTKPRSNDQEIYIGAIGDRNLTIAAEISDGAIVTMYSLSKISHALDLVKRSNSDGKEKKLFAYIPLKIAQNSEETKRARMEVARNIAFYVGSMGRYYAANLSKLGFEDSVKKIQKAHAEEGSSAAAESVDDDLIDDLSFVGDVEKIREKILTLPPTLIPVFAIDTIKDRNASNIRLNLLQPLIRELADG
jgi:alkanesulfonate monooxygenase SsuD/methylene tetrahydromethanopterin reductase-like flavin-dependent oxidoreductase (luciferase family)